MKLLLITAIKEFEKNVKDILIHSGVGAFSYSHVKGYKDLSKEEVQHNWFASSMQESESIMFMVFSPTDAIDILLENINQFNNIQEFASKIHVATLQVERTI